MLQQCPCVWTFPVWVGTKSTIWHYKVVLRSFVHYSKATVMPLEEFTVYGAIVVVIVATAENQLPNIYICFTTKSDLLFDAETVDKHTNSTKRERECGVGVNAVATLSKNKTNQTKRKNERRENTHSHWNQRTFQTNRLWTIRGIQADWLADWRLVVKSLNEEQILGRRTAGNE